MKVSELGLKISREWLTGLDFWSGSLDVVGAECRHMGSTGNAEKSAYFERFC